MSEPLATFDYAPGRLEDALLFLKRTRDELRQLRMVRVWPDRLAVFDVNLDTFEIRGLGYGDLDIVPVLDSINTAFNRDTIHNRPAGDYKEFKTGRRYPWAYDRVM
jgi:hypothetical protein